MPPKRTYSHPRIAKKLTILTSKRDTRREPQRYPALASMLHLTSEKEISILKRILLTGPLVFVFILALAVPAHADTITYTAILLGSNEVPPTGSSGTGFATFTLNGNLLSIDETFSGLTAPASAAHIHCCGPIGMNEIVAVPFTPFPNNTSGHFTATVDLTL